LKKLAPGLCRYDAVIYTESLDKSKKERKSEMAGQMNFR